MEREERRLAANQIHFLSDMSKTIVSTDQAPAAVGSYNQATKANGMLFVSGCIGIPAGESTLVSNDLKEQTEVALKNLKAIVEAGGCSLDDICKVTILLQNISDFSTVDGIYSEVMKGCKLPARACFGANGLPKGALVEIECVAALPGYNGDNGSQGKNGKDKDEHFYSNPWFIGGAIVVGGAVLSVLFDTPEDDDDFF
eukprot:TRINITY_DN805_c0_g1_i6.p1 TRINITY_DN805_c0_g1~~TRINITY_DN805_c0_g1_i6.p1  ORF type:complete len:199 (-),score=58.25 TRINITY_DN805_c0_g1_i6:395-991(-)